MNSEYSNESYVAECGRGNIDLVRRKISDGVDIHYKDKENENTGAHLAAMYDKLDVLRVLAESGFNFKADLKNKEGNTPLHIACEKPTFEVILFLLLNEIDPSVKNAKGQRAGDDNSEVRAFISNITPEEKAFNILKPQHKEKLLHVFNQLDYDHSGSLDFHKALRCNKYVENVSEAVAEKDAKDFIKSAAICNKTTVNLDEWHFAFAKTLACDELAFNKFIEDYDKREKQCGPIGKDL